MRVRSASSFRGRLHAALAHHGPVGGTGDVRVVDPHRRTSDVRANDDIAHRRTSDIRADAGAVRRAGKLEPNGLAIEPG
jgi:hypothetical protein